MNPLFPALLTAMAAHTSVQQEQRTDNRVGTYRRKIKGGKIWRFNTSTNDLEEVDIVYEKIVSIEGAAEDRQTGILEPGYIYLEALNRANAVKKLVKLNQAASNPNSSVLNHIIAL